MSMAGPAPQNHGTIMRSAASPYPAPMMYPSPGYVPQPALPMTTTAQNGNRGRGGPVMSPAISHAHAHSPAVYTASPVLLHAMQPSQNHGFMPMPAPAGRGQPRTENGASQQQLPPHNNHHPPSSHTGFSSGANTSFVRPAWWTVSTLWLHDFFTLLFICFHTVCCVCYINASALVLLLLLLWNIEYILSMLYS